MQHTKSAVLPTKNNEKSLGPKTMSWSEFIAESRQLPVKKSQQKELSSHMVVSNQGSVDKFKVEKSAGLKRKLSILDRLRQKVSKITGQKKHFLVHK